MPLRREDVHEAGRGAAAIFAANERMTQMLIAHLDDAVWRAKPPGGVRLIAAIFTHMHNVRTKWVRLTAPQLAAPPLLKRAQCTREQASAALAASARRCEEMLAEALGKKGRVEVFRRDGWAPSWPVSVEMLCYMVAHESHHRGQVCMLAHQLGAPLAHAIGDGIWNWERL